MSDLPNASSLISRVCSRLRISAIARAFYKSFLWLGGIYLVALLVSRLTGYIPTDWFPWQSLLVVPVAALVLGAIFHRRPSLGDSARQVDQHANSKDLFLTVSKLESSAGGYQALVKRDAETKAEKIEPANVVPYRWNAGLGPMFMTAAVLLLTLVFIPQFDPFGQVEAATLKTRVAENLRLSQKATTARAEQLKKDAEDLREGSETEKELKKLTAALKKMRPGKVKKANQEKVLVERKKGLNKQFNMKNSKQLREMLSKQIASQSFGGESDKKAKEWMKELKEGKADKLIAELGEIQKQLKELAEEKDPVEREKKARELKKKMQEMANFASDKANSKQMAQALERAMEQMQAGREGGEEMSEEAMKAAMESLELSKMETENLAQAAKELQRLEKALEAVQMARQLNEDERLDGSEMEGMDLEDYADFYAEMMGEGRGEGDGEGGGGGEGQGEGGPPAPEDDSQVTDFKKEESKAQIQAGKNLLSWKTKGMSEAGEFKKEVTKTLQTLEQGVSEAISKEQVPPGYSDGIKKYFKNIADESAAAGDAAPGAAASDAGDGK